MNALVELLASYLHHSTLAAQLFDAWVKSLAVLAVAGGFCALCRRAAAATRHWIWFLALASLLGLPMLSTVPHPWHRPLWTVSTEFGSGNQFSLTFHLSSVGRAAAATSPALPARTANAEVNHEAFRSRQPIVAQLSACWLALAVTVWLIGTLLGLLSVLAGQVQLGHLARNALQLQAPDWMILLRHARETLSLRRPVRLLQSTGNPMPLTWGWWRPVILLPADAANWPPERRRIVLLHELAHVKRWDCLTQTVARFVCAFFWTNPLAWVASKRMCVERERACDDLVLNTGCRASDYATHLVDIAKALHPAPHFAGIAMARSPKLHGRIAAIVDASCARRLRPLTATVILLLMGALALFMGGSGSDASGKQAQNSTLRQQQIAQLQSFAQAKEKQSRELAAKAGEQISPDFQSFFDAATKGDWQTVTNRYAYFKQHHPQYTQGTNGMEVQLRTAYWQPVLELCLAYDQVVNCEPKYTAILADGLLNSIPAGCIYFGGTDPGRGVPTAFCKSSIDGDPFFTLTQNALANGTYLEYLRAMYGGKIYTPTGEDSQNCFQEYMKGAMSRFQQHKLKPGEDAKMEDNRVQVSGQVAVMEINGLLTKVIFDQNPGRDFYVEESFPLDWMYPYLEPHQLILKLDRQPLAQLPEGIVAQDHDYWHKLVAGMLGDWLDDKTTVREIAEFVDRVYVRHDLNGFTGDLQFIRNEYAKRIFSKLRNSIAGAYAWRLSVTAPPEYRPKTEPERQALLNEADFAFRQAFALCPSNPEALARYWDLLRPSNRTDDALLLTETLLKLDPQDQGARGLLESLKSQKSQPERVGPATNDHTSLERVTPASTLTRAQAQALAEHVANEQALALYRCQPFQKGPAPKFVDGYWVWHAQQGQGAGDIEATVKFAADGTNPEVKVILLDSRSSLF